MIKIFSFLLLFLSFSTHAQTDNFQTRETQSKHEPSELAIILAPNPSNGDIHIKAPFGSTCVLTSSNGTYIGTWEVKEKGVRLEGMSSGTYVAIIQNKAQRVTRRFIVL